MSEKKNQENKKNGYSTNELKKLGIFIDKKIKN